MDIVQKHWVVFVSFRTMDLTDHLQVELSAMLTWELRVPRVHQINAVYRTLSGAFRPRGRPMPAALFLTLRPR